MKRFALFCVLLVMGTIGPAVAQTSVYPASPVITGIQFDFDSTKTLAPGSDNWPVTWADDGHQYTSWGDGGGFGGTNSDGRVSLGFGRVEGSKDDYQGFNVWGGKNPETPALFDGKCKGIISIGGTLYMWRTGAGSNTSSFNFQQLYSSTDHAVTWVASTVHYDQDDFPGNAGFFTPTFLQFGRDYDGARDGYVYTYAPEIKDTGSWEVQYPGEITLLRVPIGSITDDTINGPETFEACNSITAGPNLAVHGAVTFRTRGQIILRGGFTVASGAAFRAEIDPLTGAD